MDWFERLTGFREEGYDTTRARLGVEGASLVSRVNGQRHGIGRLELPTLHALRKRSPAVRTPGPRTTLQALAGDVRELHRDTRFAGALFQVASQFNLLEMVSPQVTPEQGVTRYEHDATQGPACAMAAGAATFYRNDFAPVGTDAIPGQTAQRQIDALAPMGQALSALLSRSVAELWNMRNGYALCTPDGLRDVADLLRGLEAQALDALRGQLSIGLHWQVEVTDAPGPSRPIVSQAFCSVLPVAYSAIPPSAWQAFATLVLEAAYEATLLAALENRRLCGSPLVLLTRLGGGAFGNDEAWIDAAILRALWAVEHQGLDVRMVCHGRIPPAVRRLEQQWQSGRADYNASPT